MTYPLITRVYDALHLAAETLEVGDLVLARAHVRNTIAMIEAAQATPLDETTADTWTDHQFRRWAIEQAIQVAAAHSDGRATFDVISCAERYIAYVRGGK